ncbi:uncharacterized protein RAG0_14995 [Rhynchosporium agropyri]|uniref:Uncharacterized protein n=1 Tax=Rhynchosporium agropyri TaxID=914238 RepID=A0A1E1LJ69_9HELO|nr:uncharacterized protein RAG0_14995 [Rhynchosporium agropyri]
MSMETPIDTGAVSAFKTTPTQQDTDLFHTQTSSMISKLEASSPLGNHLLIIQTVGTLSALLVNASILQINCHNIRGLQIHIPINLYTPAALKHTSLQMSTPHLPYIDLIPFPSIRDRLLRSQDVIDGAEVWGNIMDDVQVWGSSPWDDRGWDMGESSVKKWWWLMDDEALGSTNFWRGVRDEKALSMAEVKRLI